MDRGRSIIIDWGGGGVKRLCMQRTLWPRSVKSRMAGVPGILMLSHAIWALFWNILIQNGIQINHSQSKFRGVGHAPVAPPPPPPPRLDLPLMYPCWRISCQTIPICRNFYTYNYTDGDFWRREHHGMFLSRGLKWYWGKIISPKTKSRDLYSSRNIISNPKILGTFRDVPDNKVAICYIVWLPIAPIALPGFGIARRNLQNSVFFSAGISFKLCAVQCVSIVLCAAVQRVSIVLCAQ